MQVLVILTIIIMLKENLGCMSWICKMRREESMLGDDRHTSPMMIGVITQQLARRKVRLLRRKEDGARHTVLRDVFGCIHANTV